MAKEISLVANIKMSKTKLDNFAIELEILKSNFLGDS